MYKLTSLLNFTLTLTTFKSSHILKNKQTKKHTQHTVDGNTRLNVTNKTKTN